MKTGVPVRMVLMRRRAIEAFATRKTGIEHNDIRLSQQKGGKQSLDVERKCRLKTIHPEQDAKRLAGGWICIHDIDEPIPVQVGVIVNFFIHNIPVQAIALISLIN